MKISSDMALATQQRKENDFELEIPITPQTFTELNSTFNPPKIENHNHMMKLKAPSVGFESRIPIGRKCLHVNSPKLKRHKIPATDPRSEIWDRSKKQGSRILFVIWLFAIDFGIAQLPLYSFCQQGKLLNRKGRW